MLVLFCLCSSVQRWTVYLGLGYQYRHLDFRFVSVVLLLLLFESVVTDVITDNFVCLYALFYWSLVCLRWVITYYICSPCKRSLYIYTYISLELGWASATGHGYVSIYTIIHRSGKTLVNHFTYTQAAAHLVCVKLITWHAFLFVV